MSEKSYHIGSANFATGTLTPALYLVATPIGNLGDITIRALQTLAACDAIYCEDTRITLRLLDRYGIRNSLRNYHEHNAEKARPEIVALLKSGKSVALCSDAGTPLISDPGYRLVEACITEGCAVTSIPGASAVLTGLQLSGLPSDGFSFMGFLPEKRVARLKLLEEISTNSISTIFYESPHRVLDTLTDIATTLPFREVAAARELTKMHEEVLRGTAQVIHDQLAARESIKGEFVLVIAPTQKDETPTSETDIELAITKALLTLSASKAAAHVAKIVGLSKDDIYARILKRKNHA